MATSGKTGQPESDQEAMKDALAALIFGLARPLSREQRKALVADLYSAEQGFRSEGRQKTAELVAWLVRSAAYAEKHHGLN